MKKCHCDAPIGTEELAHIEMVNAIIYQLTRNLSLDQIEKSGFDAYFIDHTTGLYPQSAGGVPFGADSLSCSGDLLADLHVSRHSEFFS